MAIRCVLLLAIIAIVQSSPAIRPQSPDDSLVIEEDFHEQDQEEREDEVLDRQGRADPVMGKSVCTQAGGSCGHPNEAGCCKGRCTEGRCPIAAISRGKAAGGWR